MLSLFNPRLWIAMALALVATYFAGDRMRASSDRRDWQARENRIAAETAKNLASATERVRKTELAMSAKVTAIESQHVKELENARTETARVVAGIRAQRIRLYVPVRTPGDAATDTNSTAAAGNRGQTRAQLDPETAESLVGIAAEGDAAIRQLNACVNAYEAVRIDLNREGATEAAHARTGDTGRIKVTAKPGG